MFGKSGGPRYCDAGLTLMINGSVRLITGGPTSGSFFKVGLSGSGGGIVYEGKCQTLLKVTRLSIVFYKNGKNKLTY